MTIEDHEQSKGMATEVDSATIDGIGLGVVPAQKRGLEVRDRLFAAAMDEFAERGVSGSRVENIVAEAGTSWGTFFRYFPRKEDVLLYAAAELFRQHVRPTYASGLDQSKKTMREVTAEVFAQMMVPRGDPRLHAEMIAETVRHAPRFAAILDEGELPIILLVTNLIDEAQRRGEVRAEADAFECAVVLGAGVMFSTTRVLRAVADGHLPGSEIAAIAQRAFDLVWDGLTE